MKVLVIEDDPTDLKLAGAILTMNGHIVRGITSAEEAVEAIAAEKPDIILMDMQLPRMDGLALARQFKSNPLTMAIPIVAVTAYPERFRRDALLAAGCDACITKPIDTREFTKTLENAVEGKLLQPKAI
jgi:CheY-like chemotaxis protein